MPTVDFTKDELLAELDGRVRGIVREEVGRLEKVIEDSELRITTTVKQTFEHYDVRFDRVEQRLDGVEQRLDGVEQRLCGVDHRLDRIEGQLQDRRWTKR